MNLKFKLAAFAVLLLFLLPTEFSVSAEDTKSITPTNREDMINQINAIVSENLKAQKSDFSIYITGDFFKSYYHYFGSFDPAEDYFTTEIALNKFFNFSENDYYRTIKQEQSFEYMRDETNMLTGVMNGITLTYHITWKENYDQTQAVINFVKGINAGSINGYQKIKALHDYLVDNYSYDMSFADNPPYFLVNNRKYVCENFTAIFYQALKQAGFPARIVMLDSGGQQSTADGGTGSYLPHAWNMVQLDGKWYHIDLTWDENLKAKSAQKYTYFLKGDEFFKKEHRWDRLLYPAAAADYNGSTAAVTSKNAAVTSSKAAPVSSSSETPATSEISSASSEISSEASLPSTDSFTSSESGGKGANSPVVPIVVGGTGLMVVSVSGGLVYLLIIKK